MAKSKTQFVCAECGFDTVKWLGQCPTCKSWNSFKEFKIGPSSKAKNVLIKSDKQIAVQPLKEVISENKQRISTLDQEFDLVLGGGIVPGSIILLGGEPGIGKSTLLLQTILRIDRKVLYVSGEESPEQVKMRADRMSIPFDKVFISSISEISKIESIIEGEQPELVIIDSIQTIYSEEIENATGSIAQVRASASAFQHIAKQNGISIIIIGHITKDGQIAGPKLIEHVVDVVLQFEGDKLNQYRILRAAKNRFGRTDEIAIYQMDSKGLIPVLNPSQILLSKSTDSVAGCAVAISMEGQKPILVEVQALVSPSIYSAPQRTATGFDTRRLSMLLAVLEKRLGLPFTNNDVFLNLVGGVKIGDPAIDMAVIVALMSSQLDKPISRNIAFAGEIGLTGEVRAVSKSQKRIIEAKKLGFNQVFISGQGLNQKNSNASVKTVSQVYELYQQLFS